MNGHRQNPMNKQTRPKVVCPGCGHIFRTGAAMEGHFLLRGPDVRHIHLTTAEVRKLEAQFTK